MRHIPNILSSLRLILLPVFLYFALQGQFLPAGILITIISLTDLLDGYLARRNNWISQVGKVLDPLADKLTQISVIIVFFIHLPQYRWIFWILLGKEAVMLAGAGLLMYLGVKLPGAAMWGKVATALFYVTAVLVLLFPQLPSPLVTTLFIASAVTAVVSVTLYVPQYIRYRRDAAR
ncbi:CDP-alcohol phosphatidyltransferase family protein [Schleiferilactobacillus harbinensis]|jgi:cardiolipin synthase|uniref:CDP-diacylglycerol--glycerol-3-phosphate 3-phosphatidyltransferase n=1 Tax=Schleiferilactobacillus harbinensis TaxID=304207 RepID=A0ABU7T499_9LACO|nr:CDP-alcohol phosphatidyltransferase family protein [Schleiferilactobacillus harbinensis]HAY53126.1 CDP-alcohol phosphatidyltransferase family protein [Lactobacillus sp.]MCI1688429.1 CDP-alcohol phosphatidyltransferase family protein [Schleiferilactobacillus harbinensis]MCI1783568.1 CDP-alcohol phosphatidyltransferase family protein [Schleiferilactobacillus harbinensis]MCI1849707.1 CDP-alcohol phosphatidyltransferase family protein [Schleiferilactobacillus harbinensis]QEU48454.1 CDP-alcohol 